MLLMNVLLLNAPLSFCDYSKLSFINAFFFLKKKKPQNLSGSIIYGQVYSNTQVPTQVNTSQHESKLNTRPT